MSDPLVEGFLYKPQECVAALISHGLRGVAINNRITNCFDERGLFRGMYDANIVAALFDVMRPEARDRPLAS